jgi:hypothetical protein
MRTSIITEAAQLIGAVPDAAPTRCVGAECADAYVIVLSCAWDEGTGVLTPVSYFVLI